MTALCILQIPIISTSHMPEFGDDMLVSAEMLVAPYDTGCFVFVGFDPCDYADAPAFLVPIAEWAQERHFSWVRLDADGDLVAELPVYEHN